MQAVNRTPRGLQKPARLEGSLRTRAYEYIQSRILSGHLPGGTPVSEVLLSREIGSSRGPVREAIGQLVSEGLIERIPGRGIMVTRTERNDIVDLYELREALEVYTVGKVAQSQLNAPHMSVLRGLSENVRTLAEELVRSGQERLDERQMQRFIVADMGFHTLLIQAAGNARIAKVVSETHVLTRIFSYRREGHDARLLDRIYCYHVAILDAIEKGNITEAKETLREHLKASLQERLDTYDRWERQYEMNRLMRLPSQILEELDRMRIGGKGGKNTGRRHQRRTGKR
jgi:DNA-binding GntR family transcriptional regulator